MKIKCIKTNQKDTNFKIKAVCQHTEYSQYGRSNRIARVQLKWVLYSKMADVPFEQTCIKQVLGNKWYNKLFN